MSAWTPALPLDRLEPEGRAVVKLGARQILTVDTTAGRMRVRAPHDARVAVGETVGLAFQTDALVVFDGASEQAVARRPQEDVHG